MLSTEELIEAIIADTAIKYEFQVKCKRQPDDTYILTYNDDHVREMMNHLAEVITKRYDHV